MIAILSEGLNPLDGDQGEATLDAIHSTKSIQQERDRDLIRQLEAIM